jgi:phosphopantothenoylcysteine decarboxylase/phosphopantothenate--cysteine ligase
MSLVGKKIIVGVTGGIAAYKIPSLVRLLIKAGAQVQVIATAKALDFVTPITLATVSKNPVISKFTKNESGEWHNHVALGNWADLMVFAPVTANTLAKMAYGLSDNLLTTVYLSAKCPVFIAPAMDLDMYAHPATQTNIERLKSFGHTIIPATKGELASGLSGFGRMEEPENIFQSIQQFFEKKKTLLGKKVLITAGPTYEKIDPVRFIGNHSSGKMGIALAETAANLGAEVELILGPTNLSATHPNIHTTKVVSAEEMYQVTHKHFKQTDIAILAAAVADFTPKTKANHKIKKDGNTLSLELTATKDILASLGIIKNNKQVLVGFAMETNNEIENATKKLKKKNLNFIVLNSLNEKNAGFKHSTNKVTIIDDKGTITPYELKTKLEVAEDIFNKIDSYLV